jgi:hypothetical protein
MASIHGTNCVVSLDNGSGTPVDVTAYTDDLTPEMSQAMHDITVFGMTALAKTPGLKDGKCSIQFIANNTIMDQLTGLYTAQTPGSSTTWTITIGPRGSTSGFEKFSAELLLVTLPLPIKVNDIERISAAFDVTGGWTIGTY